MFKKKLDAFIQVNGRGKPCLGPEQSSMRHKLSEIYYSFPEMGYVSFLKVTFS